MFIAKKRAADNNLLAKRLFLNFISEFLFYKINTIRRSSLLKSKYGPPRGYTAPPAGGGALLPPRGRVGVPAAEHENSNRDLSV